MFKPGDKVVIKRGERRTGGGAEYLAFCEEHSRIGTVFEISDVGWAVFVKGFDWCWESGDLQLASIELENK